jgi:hypothetical protein
LQSNVQIVTAGAVGFNLTLLTPTQAFWRQIKNSIVCGCWSRWKVMLFFPQGFKLLDWTQARFSPISRWCIVCGCVGVRRRRETPVAAPKAEIFDGNICTVGGIHRGYVRDNHIAYHLKGQEQCRNITRNIVTYW